MRHIRQRGLCRHIQQYGYVAAAPSNLLSHHDDTSALQQTTQQVSAQLIDWFRCSHPPCCMGSSSSHQMIYNHSNILFHALTGPPAPSNQPTRAKTPPSRQQHLDNAMKNQQLAVFLLVVVLLSSAMVNAGRGSRKLKVVRASGSGGGLVGAVVCGQRGVCGQSQQLDHVTATQPDTTPTCLLQANKAATPRYHSITH